LVNQKLETAQMDAVSQHPIGVKGGARLFMHENLMANGTIYRLDVFLKMVCGK
jgi:hypothetical protein